MKQFKNLIWSPIAAFQENTKEVETLVDDFIGFSFELFAEIYRCDGEKNIFFSPLSIGLALSVMQLGAKGETQEAIAKTLHSQPMDLDTFRKAGAALMKLLTRYGSGVSLNLAHSLVVRKDLPLEPNFKHIAESDYQANVKSLDFNSSAATDAINAWVSHQTHGKISHIINSLDPLAGLVLVNAIYFSGRWHLPFKRKDTRPGVFTLLTGEEKEHPMMSVTDDFQYLRTQKFQAIRLPYKKKQLTKYIFLPSQKSSLSEL
jgi:serpin B